MVYKIIDEYEREDLHELTIYKYNINHDEMYRYIVDKLRNELEIYCMNAIYGKVQIATEGLKK